MQELEQEGPLDSLEEPESEVVQPSETQGGAVDKEAQLALVDTYLHRLFTVGEFLPWKGCMMQVIGIRGGVVGLMVTRMKEAPRAKHNHGRMPSDSKKKRKR